MIEKPIVADALLSLSPNAQFVVDDGNVLWYSPDIPQPSEEEINTELARLQAEYDSTQYKRDRAPEYPPIGDQLDALLKHLNYRRTQGDELVQELDDVIAEWLSVKSRHPKP